jgi:obg-like ATPase 1
MRLISVRALQNVERGLGGREKKLEFDCLEKVLSYMVDQRKAVRFGDWTPFEVEVLNRFQLLTAKEVVYLVNLSKRDFLRKVRLSC